MKTFLAAILFLASVASVEAATYWVHPSGTATTCIASETPLTTQARRTVTLGKGCPTQPGDVLNIVAGTYTEKIDWSSGTSSGTASNPIIIQGFGGTVTIRGTGGSCAGPTCEATLYLSNRSGLIFQGITINHGNINQYAAIDINVGLSGGPVDDVTFDNVEVTGGAQGFMLRNFGCPDNPNIPGNTCDGTTPNRIVIKNSRIHTNGASPRFDHGMYIGKCRGCTIENNEVYNNSGNGITLGDEITSTDVNNIEVRYNRSYSNGRLISGASEQGGYGLHVSGASNIRFHHNQSYRNNGTGFFWDGGGTFQFYHNTVTGNRSTATTDAWCIQLGLHAGAVNSASNIKNNICYDNQTGTTSFLTGAPTLSNNLFTNPLFTNPSSDDYTLQAGSPAIDGNTTTTICSTCSPAITITQFSGVRPDFGWWESGSTTPPGGPPSLVANPLALAGGTTVTAIVTENVAVPRTESVTDFVGIYAIGASGADFIDWRYANCTQTAPAVAVGNWSCPFTAPKVTASYELRFYAANQITDDAKLATAGFTVVPGRVIRVGSGNLTTGSGSFQSGE